MFSLCVQRAAGLNRDALLKLLIKCPGAYDYETYSKSLDTFNKYTFLNVKDMPEVLKASDTCLSTTHGELVIHKLPLSDVFLVLDEGRPWVSPFIEVEGQFYMPQDYSKTNPKIHDTSDTFYFPE